MHRGVVREPPGEETRQVVHHHRRGRRLVVEPRVTALDPGEEGPVHVRAESGDRRARIRSRCAGSGDQRARLRPRRGGGLRQENAEFGPAEGERRPVPVIRIRAGDRRADGLCEATEAAPPVRVEVDADSDRRPCFAKGGAGLVGNGAQHPFDEQVVDVDTDVFMVEGQVRGSADGEAGRPFHLLPAAVSGVA